MVVRNRPEFDDDVVRRLIDDQFPEWSSLPLDRVLPGGSDHAIYRLGTELGVRVPLHSGAMDQAVKDAFWLPKLAPHLPLEIPAPVVVGEPGFGYPWPWLVCRWLDGQTATVEEFGDSAEAAVELAGFLNALQQYVVEVPTNWRERLTRDPLSERDETTRKHINETSAAFDESGMLAVWEAALAAEPGPARWVHGDFHTGNLLAANGRITTVLDFGSFGLGDPAVDLMMAYTLMTPRSRAIFQDRLELDDAAWKRGRGWALSTGLSAYTAYATTKPHVAAQTTQQITQALLG